jgi:murein DD-endopeptidase MepM/ murein hydrolase activator NlpD
MLTSTTSRKMDYRMIRLLVVLVSLLLIAPVHAQDAALDAAVTAALDAYNALAMNPHRYRELGRIADDTGAVIFVEAIDRATGEAYPGLIDWVYAAYASGRWTVTLPGAPTYRSVYRAFSDALKAEVEAADTTYRVQAIPDRVPAARLTDYDLPFPDGATGVVTRSYGVHGVGRIDIDLTAREISAAKDGLIVYADDRSSIQTFESGAWWYWNTVIIQHGEYEYSLYGHIEQGSLPDWIRTACSPETMPCSVPVRAGEVIALEGNTGNSSNPHLHLEFGQEMGIAYYLDVRDGDSDGIRTEIVRAAYVYREHNVALNGTPADEVAAWPYLTVLQSGS